MKIRYKDAVKERIFETLEDASRELGFKPYMIRHFLKGDAKTYKEYNDRLSYVTDETNEFGTELLIEAIIPGVTDIDKVVGIPVIYTEKDGSVHKFDSLLECHKHSNLSTNGLVAALQYRGKLAGRVTLNNGNEFCSYMRGVGSMTYSEDYSSDMIDPTNFGADFATEYRKEIYQLTRQLGSDLKTVDNLHVKYIDTFGVVHEYGTIKETSDYLKIHVLEILRSISGIGGLYGRFIL